MRANFIDRADIGVIQRGRSTRLAPKAFQRLGIFGKVVSQELESDKSTEMGVFRLVDDPHAATAEFLDNAVMRNGLAYHVMEILCPALWEVNESSFTTKLHEIVIVARTKRINSIDPHGQFGNRSKEESVENFPYGSEQACVLLNGCTALLIARVLSSSPTSSTEPRTIVQFSIAQKPAANERWKCLSFRPFEVALVLAHKELILGIAV